MTYTTGLSNIMIYRWELHIFKILENVIQKAM
jgi:hypothetical protein